MTLTVATERVAWIDAQVGIAGDMLLAALVDAGASADIVRRGLGELGLEDWTLGFKEVRRGAFRALRADVRVGGVGGDSVQQFKPVAPPRGPMRAHITPHVHRPWRVLRATLEAAPLPPRALARALAAYGRLAEAEARLHGMPVDDVELHEVGGTDAILDIVGSCLALELLGIDRIVASPLPLAMGSVKAAHGEIPMPAPATLEVLRGWPVIPCDRPGEWVTPTGAALVSALAQPGPPPSMVIGAIGHGAGHRDPAGIANLVRVVVGEAALERALPAALVPTDQIVELAANLDDLPGQLVPPAIDALLTAGALDAWVETVTMKKGRPGFIIHALCSPADADRISDALLRHTSTLGVRRFEGDRRLLERWIESVETPWGPVRVKVGGRGGVAWHAWPEFEDCAALAATHELPIPEIQQAALTAWRNRAR